MSEPTLNLEGLERLDRMIDRLERGPGGLVSDARVDGYLVARDLLVATPSEGGEENAV